ncbi:hypothetical protein BC628DRAFT_1423178 [Trametes gibbosa]|nr:hypothetical protein BC628DRAFT_1423178 [Trametes gibbosa]
MPSDATEAALGLLGLTAAFPSPAPSSSSPSASTVPAKRKQQPSATPIDPSATSDTISCICGIPNDDGFSIACDACGRWCHAACFQIDEHQVPDEWLCWRCDPRPVDKDRAVKIQRARQRPAAHPPHLNKRRASPGVDRRSRKPSGVSTDPHPNKRKRRVSITAAAHAHQLQAEDEHVDIDEPWQQSYVPIPKDIVTSDDARDRLRRFSADWRGVSAISPSPSLTPGSSTPALLTPDAVPSHPPISLQPLPNNSSYPSLFASGNPSVRPPLYTVHATQPIPSSKYIAPYPSTIVSTAAYLADPLNSYAHLGLPKPHVHLIGPPLDVALDARFTGDQSRFVRSGCRPNAVIRPVLCHSKKSSASMPEDTLSFGIFALRDLKPNEEIVLGWEWDDGNVVHHLPALIESPFEFPPHQIQHFRKQMTSLLHTLSYTFTTCACGAKARDCALARMAEFVETQTPLTPEPSPPSQFTKEKNAARGGKGAPDDTLSTSASATPVDLGPLVGIERGFRTRERIPSSGGMGGVEMVPSEAGPSRMHAEPLSEMPSASGRRVSFPDDLLSPPVKARRGKGRDKKGKARAEDEDIMEESDGDVGSVKSRSRIRRRESLDPDQGGMDVDEVSPVPEEKLPPKLRKAWIRESAARLHEQRRRMSTSQDAKQQNAPELAGVAEDATTGGAETFDSREMPPPPVPPSRTPPLSSVPTNNVRPHPPPLLSSAAVAKQSRTLADAQASPSMPFSKLSLLSPVASATPVTSATPALPYTNAESASPSPALSTASLPPSTPASTRKRKPSASQASATGKDEKKPKSRARKEKGRDKGLEKDMTQDGEKEPATPTAGTPSTPSDPTAILPPSLVHKEGTGTAKRRKSTAANNAVTVSKARAKAKVNDKVKAERVKGKEHAEKEENSTPKSLHVLVQEVSPSTSGVSSPAVVSTALPTLAHAVEVPFEPSASPSTSTPLLTSSVPSEPADVAPSAPTRPSEDGKPALANVNTLDVSVLPLPLPEVVIEDVQMSDEPPPPTSADPQLSQDLSVSERQSSPPLLTAQASSSPVVPAVALQSPTVPDASQLFDCDDHPSSPMNVVGSARASTPLTDVSQHASTLCIRDPSSDPARPKTPPPPPKVKLSLKDFAMRKKKQREEQQQERTHTSMSASASPQVSMPGLPENGLQVSAPPPLEDAASVEDGRKDGAEHSPVMETPPSVHRDPDGDVHMDIESAVSEPPRPVIPPPMDVTTHPEVSTTLVPVEETPVSLYAESKELAVEISQVEGVNGPQPVSSLSHSPKPVSKSLLFGENSLPAWHTSADNSFRAKVEVLEDRIPNGHDQPQRSDRERPRSYSPHPYTPSSASPIRDRFPETNFTPTHRLSVSSSAYSSSRHSPTPPRRPSSPPSRFYSPHKSELSPYTCPREPPAAAASALAAPPPTHHSQEDGEIFSPPPVKALPLAPPTQPRSFYTSLALGGGGNVSPPPLPSRRTPPPPIRRPLHPASYRNATAARPLPSAPRALRAPGAYQMYSGSGTGGGGGGGGAAGGQNAPYYAPRGPSADRDRDRGSRDRERERDRDRDRDSRDRDRDRERERRDWGRERGDGERTWIPGPSRGRGRGWGR